MEPVRKLLAGSSGGRLPITAHAGTQVKAAIPATSVQAPEFLLLRSAVYHIAPKMSTSSSPGPVSVFLYVAKRTRQMGLS